MKNIMKIVLKQDASYELVVTIKKVEQEEKLKAEELANQSTYVNPLVLRFDYQQKPAGVIFWSQNEDYCPV